MEHAHHLIVFNGLSTGVVHHACIIKMLWLDILWMWVAGCWIQDTAFWLMIYRNECVLVLLDDAREYQRLPQHSRCSLWLILHQRTRILVTCSTIDRKRDISQLGCLKEDFGTFNRTR